MQVPTEVRREHLILLQPFIRCLLCMLGSELRSSDRVVSSLNGWTISLVPYFASLEKVWLCGPGWPCAASSCPSAGIRDVHLYSWLLYSFKMFSLSLRIPYMRTMKYVEIFPHHHGGGLDSLPLPIPDLSRYKKPLTGCKGLRKEVKKESLACGPSSHCSLCEPETDSLAEERHCSMAHSNCRLASISLANG